MLNENMNYELIGERGRGGVAYCLKKAVYLTIRLRARDFYEVIVDEGEARINYHFIEIESE